MAFADGNDLVSRFDIRLIGDLVTDAGVTLPSAEVPTHPNLLTALEDASGEIVVNLQAGQRYNESQLLALTGYSLSHLKRVCCDIAMALLIKRRPILDENRAGEIAKQAREHLRNLADGKNIFGIPEVLESGNLDLAEPSTVDITNLNLIPERMRRYFPDTFQRMPRGR
jgi:phage gp36-like protein